MVFDVGSSNRVSQSHLQRSESTRETGALGGMSVTIGEAQTPPASSSTFADKAKAFFQKIGNFFSKIGERISDAFHDLKARWQPQAPTPAPTGPLAQTQSKPVPTAPPLESLKLKADDVFSTPGAKGFDAKGSSIETRNAFTYGHVKEQADHIAELDGDLQSNQIDSFLRGVNPQSLSARENFREGFVFTMFTEGFEDMVGDQYYPVRSNMYGRVMSEHPEQTQDEIAERTVAKIDQVMVSMFGDPDIEGSIEEAAAKLPQSLCDHLVIAFAAIDQSDCSDEIKQQLKDNVARDALALRTFCPAMTDLAVSSENPIIKANGVDIAKGIQSIVNNAHFTDSSKGQTVDAFADRSEALFDRWQPAFKSFTEAVLARGNPEIVAPAALAAQERVDAFPDVMADWNAKIDQGIDPRVG